MPAKIQSITDEHYECVQKYFRDKKIKLTCPCCHASPGGFIRPVLFGVEGWRSDTMKRSGQGPIFVSLGCAECGYELLFSAHIFGCFKLS